jgi:hypothetical protein
MDNMLPSTNALFNVPQLAKDSLNWITYKERALMALGTRGLMRYTDSHAVKPIPFNVDSTGNTVKKDGTAATQTKIDELDEKINIYHQKNSLVKQQIFSMIMD